MMDFIENIIKIIMMILLTIFTSLTSLFTAKDNKQVNNQEIKYGLEFIQEKGPQIIDCLNKKDKQALNNLFCNKIKDTEYLEKKIDYLFDYIEIMGGINIDVLGEWKPAGGSHGSLNYGEPIIEYEGYEYDKKIKIGATEYNLDVSFYLINKNHKEYEGITRIFLWNQQKNIASQSDIKASNNNHKKDFYLGFDIINFNNNTYSWESVIPNEINEIDEYKVSFKEIEKNAHKEGVEFQLN